jgi:hypothetical protein
MLRSPIEWMYCSGCVRILPIVQVTTGQLCVLLAVTDCTAGVASILLVCGLPLCGIWLQSYLRYFHICCPAPHSIILCSSVSVVLQCLHLSVGDIYFVQSYICFKYIMNCSVPNGFLFFYNWCVV